MDRRNFLKVFGIGVGTAAATAATVISPTIVQAQKIEENSVEKTLKEIYATVKEIDVVLPNRTRSGFCATIMSFENGLYIRLFVNDFSRHYDYGRISKQLKYKLDIDDTNKDVLNKMFVKTQTKAGRNEFITRLKNGKLLTISDIQEFVNS